MLMGCKAIRHSHDFDNVQKQLTQRQKKPYKRVQPHNFALSSI